MKDALEDVEDIITSGISKSKSKESVKRTTS